MADAARRVGVWFGLARHGRHALARRGTLGGAGTAGPVAVRQRVVRQVWQVMAVLERLVGAWQVWQAMVEQALARQASHGEARFGGCGMAA